MAHFYASCSGRASTEASRLGNKATGVSALCAGWNGAIRVHVWHDGKTGHDMYEVRLTPWKGSGGEDYLIERGALYA